ncbi:hypothetical protein ASE17_08055 [Phenylobacterium sp. Root77]|uniref:hypothetical protein n=1 Tax=unclassified Phenylobacterium TaxID=2640670 RepID=UPI0006FC652F|nr:MULTISPECIES: hypothetical protein [unclassified Phenylobacterium]KQW72912.1 hypothetical protein ASC73_00625 [Phenylobacterium sp. Root1277]KQW92130.1 hypothetical protein ASC79_11335 [Phenylobacterium sp. Root1290]KRC40361.1 hypothetical protein ASE17_08055 [Phenylobacterium sp. Root77]
MSSNTDTITSDLIDFRFPLIGFTPDREIWGFPDRKSLTTCGVLTLREGKSLGMELIDGDGGCWRVTAIHDKGRARSLIPWLIKALLSGRLYRIEYSLMRLEETSLNEVKARACKSLEAFPDDYCLFDERETVLLPLMEQVHAADSVDEIFKLLGLDSFEAY